MPIKMSRDWKLKKRTIKHPSFDDDENVVIKSYYGDHDRQRVMSASSEYTRDEESGQMRVVATLDRMSALKREIAVVSWNLKDEDGFPLPFTPEVLRALPSTIASWLDEEINKDWDNLGEPARSQEELDARAQEDKERRSTFQRAGVRADGGRQAHGRADEPARAGDAERGGVQAAGA